MIFGQIEDLGMLDEPSIGDHDVDLALLDFDGPVQSVEVCRVRYIALHDRDVSSNIKLGFMQLGLTAPRNEHVCAFPDEPFRGCQTYAA